MSFLRLRFLLIKLNSEICSSLGQGQEYQLLNTCDNLGLLASLSIILISNISTY